MLSRSLSSTMRNGLRCAIVSDHRVFAEALALLLRSEHIQVTSLVSPYHAAQEPQFGHADVILLDGSDPAMLNTVKQLANLHVDARLVWLGVRSIEDVVACAEAGASGYVSREADSRELFAVLESIVRDELPCSPRIAATIFRRLAAKTDDRRTREAAILTDRELEILDLIAAGCSNKEIA